MIAALFRMPVFRFALLFLVFLVACSHEQPGGGSSSLSPEEVLKRTATAAQSLESAQYTATGEFDAREGHKWRADGSLRMDGAMLGGGKQMRMQLDTESLYHDGEGDHAIDATLEVLVIGKNEVYMNLHSFTAQPGSNLFRPELIGAVASKWWLLPPGDTLPAGSTVTPDPSLLHAQSAVVSVTRDRGLEEVRGRMSHHYDVEINHEKLVAYLSKVAEERGEEFSVADVEDQFEAMDADGQLWIDAETYYIQRLRWVVESLPLESGGKASLSFTVDFRDHNQAPPLSPPEDFELFTPLVLLTPTVESLFESLPEGGDLDEEALQHILRSP